MVLQGWDLNSSSTTNATPWLLSSGWWRFRLLSTLRFTPRWSMFGVIEEFHSILTLPMSHHRYNEWLEKVEIGICALWWSPQRVFQSLVGSKLAWPYCPLFTPRLSEFGLIGAIHSISTLPISHFKYNEWLDKVQIWVHHVLQSQRIHCENGCIWKRKNPL